MKILSDPPNAELDIIFVHGLTGNREKTWTHKKGVFWPQDLLAKDFPTVRIMTFGYEVDIATLFTIASSNRVYDHGQSLAYALVSERDGCSARPILLIAHGLGGLVCQQALIRSTQVDGLWQISSWAVGIIFIGTPHSGSSLACHGERLARYLSPVQTAEMRTAGTKPGPNDLQRIGNQFQDMLRGGDISLKVFCFYETKQMNDLVGKIVEESSAVLSDFKSCRVDANHFNVAKFSGRLDAGYEHLRTLVASLIETSQKDEAAFVESSNQAFVASFSMSLSCSTAPSPTNYTLDGHTYLNSFQDVDLIDLSTFTFT
ncbi:uncharacterized protein N7511_006960 [Penicillium nucicola]|uniref:uncharacterized protein n=1 Tax=Penicillium nucicola TaxID=1850975 RepID=UPI0025459F37|nr:uncharacterized protein N7511_006960 [Penicillium nucicola]KAJ5758266.1 hypothetical protein N7511_006960 [Penicillium nucicola]